MKEGAVIMVSGAWHDLESIEFRGYPPVHPVGR